jgi:hypothetical protein
LHFEHGVEPKNINPDLVYAYQEMHRKRSQTAEQIGEYVGAGSDSMGDE